MKHVPFPLGKKKSTTAEFKAVLHGLRVLRLCGSVNSRSLQRIRSEAISSGDRLVES